MIGADTNKIALLLLGSEFLNILSLYNRKEIPHHDDSVKALDFAGRLTGAWEHHAPPVAVQNSAGLVWPAETPVTKWVACEIKKILRRFPSIASTPEDYSALK